MFAAEFLDLEAKRPFVWGETDCASTADRWFMIERGFSPMARYGRRVTDAINGEAWMNERGGILRAARAVARACGVTLLRGAPISGDIGIIVVDGKACIGVYDGVTWRSRDSDGFIAADDTHRFTAWEVSTCRKRSAHLP